MSPRAAEVLGQAYRVVVFTGAGMSAESGVPTFRDDLTGLWARFDPQELATPEALQVNPEPIPLDPVCAINLRGTAAQVLPALVAAAWDH